MNNKTFTTLVVLLKSAEKNGKLEKKDVDAIARNYKAKPFGEIPADTFKERHRLLTTINPRLETPHGTFILYKGQLYLG